MNPGAPGCAPEPNLPNLNLDVQVRVRRLAAPNLNVQVQVRIKLPEPEPNRTATSVGFPVNEQLAMSDMFVLSGSAS